MIFPMTSHIQYKLKVFVFGGLHEYEIASFFSKQKICISFANFFYLHLAFRCDNFNLLMTAETSERSTESAVTHTDLIVDVKRLTENSRCIRS